MGMNRSLPVHRQIKLVSYDQATMAIEPDTEAYICVDVETTGPIPGDYSMLSIGACTIFEPQRTFYIELKPINQNSIEEAASIHALSLERLMVDGVAPKEALTRFEAWLVNEAAPNQQPLFVAFNAAFDWMFINYYFYHYLDHNPFGHAAIDIKAFYMGMADVPWSQTSWRFISPKYMTEHSLTHHALQDALDQADMFKKMIEEMHNGNKTTGDDQV
jgi:DNA polymerase III epsilon subunit-like protein